MCNLQVSNKDVVHFDERSGDRAILLSNQNGDWAYCVSKLTPGQGNRSNHLKLYI